MNRSKRFLIGGVAVFALVAGICLEAIRAKFKEFHK